MTPRPTRPPVLEVDRLLDGFRRAVGAPMTASHAQLAAALRELATCGNVMLRHESDRIALREGALDHVTGMMIVSDPAALVAAAWADVERTAPGVAS